MKIFQTSFLAACLLMILRGPDCQAQNKTWKLEDCINYALGKNIQVLKSDLTSNQNRLNANQAKSNLLPSVSASVNENMNWYKGFDSVSGHYGSASGSNYTNYGVNSNVTLYNGKKLSTQIRQTELNFQSGKFYSQSVRESVGLNIINAYLQVLYAYESVNNAEKQIESTTKQLDLAKERMDLGVIASSDYLQIKSELASEKFTLATAQSQLSTDNVTLEQLMELPVDPNFTISSPNLNSLLVQFVPPNSQEVYNLALGIKPEIKNIELTKESTALNVKIAKADFIPTISMNAGLSSNYSSLNVGSTYGAQLSNTLSPSVGISLSIPVYQKKQIKTNVAIANIAVSNAELDVVNAKNLLRKEIEQACTNVTSAWSQYTASLEQMQSSRESYDVTTEKFKVGLLNSVDFLVQKTSLITSESKLLQAKFNLIFSYKVLDFYKGVPLTL
jgi:outer membrane protein